MNREIKFKIWDKASKHYLNPSFFTIDGNGQLGMVAVKTNYVPYFKDIIIQQFTGLKDKNGREIYEGDILRSADYTNGKVVYESKIAAFLISFDLNSNYINHDNSLLFVREPFTGYHANKSKVIGNIFENPELLK